MKRISREELTSFFTGRTVAVVGSGPGVLDNERGFVDSHELVVRINNWKCINEATGFRTDCMYSFFGSYIKKAANELVRAAIMPAGGGK